MNIIDGVLLEAPASFTISDAHFSELEEVGRVSLSPELRERLNQIGHFWLMQLATVRSPRPKQFRKRLKQIADTLTRAYQALDLNREGAPTWERRMFQWPPNTGLEGTQNFMADTNEPLQRMKRMIQLTAKLEAELPVDRRGGWRPHEDEWFLGKLADVYQDAGGAAVAYWSDYSESGMADTEHHRDLRARLRAQAPTHIRTGHNQDRHIMTLSPPTHDRPDRRYSYWLAAGSDRTRIGPLNWPAAPTSISSCAGRSTRLHPRAPTSLKGNRARRPQRSNLRRPKPAAKSP